MYAEDSAVQVKQETQAHRVDLDIALNSVSIAGPRSNTKSSKVDDGITF